jgi:hypothetical protein
MPVLSRFSSAMSLKKVFAKIKFMADSSAVYSSLVISVPIKVNPVLKAGSVSCVLSNSYASQVAPAIVKFASIDVVYLLFRLLSSHKKVSKPVSKKGSAFVANSKVAAVVRSLLALAPKLSGFWIVPQDFFDGFGYKFRSHSDTSYVGLVRGLVVDATNAPILSRGICL